MGNPTIDIARLASTINQMTVAHGFWDEGEDRNFGEMMALADSELSEALEEHRAGKPAEYTPVHRPSCPSSVSGSLAKLPCDGMCKPEGIVVELADCAIRCLDTIYHMNNVAPYACHLDLNEQYARLLEDSAAANELPDNFAECTKLISKHTGYAYDARPTASAGARNEPMMAIMYLLIVVSMCERLAQKQPGWDKNFWAVVTRKMDYNDTRPHKHDKAY